MHVIRTIRKEKNVGCHGTSYVSCRALVGSHSIPDVDGGDYKGVTILEEDGRIVFDLATSEHPAELHGGADTGTVCAAGEGEDCGLSSWRNWDVGGRGVDVGPSTRHRDGCTSGRG